MKNNCGIYKISNLISNKFYIGSSIDINRRWKEHKNDLKKNKHDNEYLQNSWNKYGEETFLFEIIEIVNDKNNLIIYEQKYLDDLKNNYKKDEYYNICLNAKNMLGFKHSNETKEKMSNLHKNNKYSLGFKHSNETKEKMSNSKVGSIHKKETIIKLINLKQNFKQKEETKKKLSEINKNKISKVKKEIYQLDMNDNILKLWNSVTDAANFFKITPSSISSVCNGRRKTCKNFKWKFKNIIEKKIIDETEIKTLYLTGEYSIRNLSKKFNISKSRIWEILKNN